MTHLFYIIIGTLAAFELGKAINCRYIHAEFGKLRRMNKSDRQLYLGFTPELRVITILDNIELGFCVAGIFQPEWPFFVFVILQSLSRFQYLGSWATCIDSILTVGVFVSAILFHYNWI